MIKEVLAAVIGTVAFSLLFGVHRNYYVYCGIIGGMGWAVYRLSGVWCSPTVSSLMATMVVIFLSRVTAVKKHCPVTVFLIAGIFPLVPGTGVYWTSYYIVTDQLALAMETGYAAVKAAVAIVFGIILVFEIPQRFFDRLFLKRVK